MKIRFGFSNFDEFNLTWFQKFKVHTNIKMMANLRGIHPIVYFVFIRDKSVVNNELVWSSTQKKL